MQKLPVLLAFLVAALVPLAAQLTTGVISGYVFDPSGRPAAGAQVRAEHSGRGLVRQAEADATGFYRLAGLAVGEYTLKVSAANLQAATREGVRVDVDARMRQDFTLPLAGRTEAVTVVAPVTPLSWESPDLGALLDRSRVQDLPLGRRDFLHLALLAPGVMPPVQDSELSSRGSFAMHASGGREEFNNFLLDGADNNDFYTNRYVLQPPVDSIGEFKVLTSTYSAEYGRGGAGQVNVVTRSGGAAWHGDLYEYFRHRRLDARNFFDAAGKPNYVRHQAGVAAGGPIRRERAFLFAGFDGLGERRGLSRLGSVPGAAERGGDLSRLPGPVSDPFTRRPFPENRIPASRIAAAAPSVLALYPLPNRDGLAGNLLSQPVLEETVWQGLARLDHRINAANDLMLRYGYGRQDLLEPFAEESTDIPGFGDLVRNTGHNLTAYWQRVLSPRTIQSLRLSLGRSFRRALQQNHAVDVGALWGVPWLRVRPRDFGFPSIKVAGYSLAGDVDTLPIERRSELYQIQYTLTLTRGPHLLKSGVDIRHMHLDGYLDYFARGSITFSGALSGAGIGDLLLGLPSFAIQSQFDNPQRLLATAWNGWIQDDWRLGRHFTLSLGLRYELNRPPVDPEDNMTVLLPSSGTLTRVGTAGVPRAGIPADRNNFAPRIGFAWSPAANLAVRGGYGIYHDSGMLVVNSSLYFNPPQFNVRVFFPTATSLLTLDDPFPARGGLTPPPSPNTLSPDLATSYLQHWSFSLEPRLGSSTTLRLAYAGSKGTRLVRSRDLNQPRPGPGPVGARRPNPAFSGVFFIERGGNSSFQSLQASLDRRLSRGFSLLAAYTWSKSIDEASAFLGTRPDKNFPQDSNNWRAERGRSSFDLRHRLSLAYTWAPGRRLGGVEIRSITALQGGRPFTPLLRFDNSNTGNTGGIFGSDRPDLVGDTRQDRRSAERWFNTSAFAVPERFRFGSAGRNIVTGPSLFTFDVALARRFTLRESWKLAVEAQAFNLFNRANFDLPERYADEPASFGRIFSAQAPRQAQIALRLSF